MALVGGYEDSGGGTTYPRRTSTAPVSAPPIAPPVASAPAPAPDPAPTTPAPAPTTAPAPAPPGIPSPRFNIQPVDSGKFNDPTHRDGKYDFLRAAGQYNPQQGISAGLLGDLNKLGYANFSGSGQRLSYGNVTDAGRAAGLEANGFSGDFIQNWNNGQNPNAQWAWNWQDPNPGQSPQDPSSGLDPQTLTALMGLMGHNGQGQGQDLSWLAPILQSVVNQPQAAPQATVVPPSPEAAIYRQPIPLVTQAQPMMAPTSAGGGGASVQTQSVDPRALGTDPFTAWLKAQLGGAGA